MTASSSDHTGLDRVGLAGTRVVVCRSARQSASLTRELEQAGAQVEHLALLPVVLPADGGDALRQAVLRLHEFDWVTVTSANGAVAFIDAAAGRRPVPVRIAAVGRATAAVLEAAGLAVEHVAAPSTAAALAAGLPTTNGRRVLAPLAQLAGRDLTEGLEARGFVVTRVEAYRLGDAPRLDEATLQRVEASDAVLFTSPSTVDRFAAQCPWPPTVVSIGPSTSARLRSVGRVPSAEADPPGLDGLIAALVNTLNP